MCPGTYRRRACGGWVVDLHRSERGVRGDVVGESSSVQVLKRRNSASACSYVPRYVACIPALLFLPPSILGFQLLAALQVSSARAHLRSMCSSSPFHRPLPRPAHDLPHTARATIARIRAVPWYAMPKSFVALGHGTPSRLVMTVSLTQVHARVPTGPVVCGSR